MTTWEEIKELGNVQFKNKEYNQAISLYSDAIKLDPEQEILYANRAMCYKAQNNYRSAIIDMDKSLTLNPKNIKNIKRKSELNLIIGKISESIQLIERCVNIEPKERSHRDDLFKANLHLSSLNTILKDYELEKYEESEKAAKSLLSVCPSFKELKVVYIESLINNNKLQEASEFWSTKLSENERCDDEFLYLICKIFYYEGNYEKSRTFLKKLLNKVNDNGKYNKLFSIVNLVEKEKEKANLLFKENKFEEAILSYTHLQSLDQKNKVFNSTIIANRALCYTKLDKNVQALEDLNQSILLNDKYVKGILRRANLYMKMADYENAKYDYKKIIEIDPGNYEAKKGHEEAKKQEKIAKKKDYYKVLELSKDASESQIRKAYKVLALKWHPDKNAQSETQRAIAEKKFKEITEAYEVLSDAKKKNMFDNGMDPNDPESGAHSSGFGGGDPHDIFNMFFGGGSSGFHSEEQHYGGNRRKSGRGGQSFTFTYK